MKHLLLAAFCLLLSLSLHARGQCTEDRFEPNTDCPDAIHLAPGSYLGLALADGADCFRFVVPPHGKVTVDVFYDPIGPPLLDMLSVQLTSSAPCIGSSQVVYTGAGHRRAVQTNLGSTVRILEIRLTPNQSCVAYDLYVTEDGELGATPVCGASGASAHNCPCANQGYELFHGCHNSTGSGVVLTGTGHSGLSHDGLRLDASGFPAGAAALLVQGTDSNGPGSVHLGDGILCLTGSLNRFPIRVASDGSAAWGEGVAGDPPLSVSGLVLQPGARFYQVWYRDAPDFCTPDAFNLSNGVKVLWMP